MTISPAQLNDLREGDLIRTHGWQNLDVEGTVRSDAIGDLWLGHHQQLTLMGRREQPEWTTRADSTLVVISRTPRPPASTRPEVRAGDLVQLTHTGWPAGTTLLGRVWVDGSTLGRNELRVGFVYLDADLEEDPGYTLHVVAAAPRLYVNHERAEPRWRDVAVPDGDDHRFTYIYGGEGQWRDQHGEIWEGDRLPQLRLLIDGVTGEPVRGAG